MLKRYIKMITNSRVYDVAQKTPLEEAGRVLLVAAEPIQRFGENDIELVIQRVAHQRLES